MHVLIHEKPVIWGTWAPHAIDGWYLGPALQSYWCYTVWSKETHAQCICDTLTWLPATPSVPEASTTDYILAGISNIANALCKPVPNSPIAPLTDSQVSTLEQLMVILHGPAKGSQQHQNKKQSNHDPPLRVGPATTQPPNPSPAVVPAAATTLAGPPLRMVQHDWPNLLTIGTEHALCTGHVVPPGMSLPWQ